MGTRSRIALQTKDGRLRSIYAHWDGYPSWNGAMLKKHWSDPAKLGRLLKLGCISILAPRLGTKVDFDNPPKNGKYGPVTQVLAYGRDRGEEDVDLQEHTDRAALVEAADNCSGEYIYLFSGGRRGHWEVYKIGTDGPWSPLDEVLGSLKALGDFQGWVDSDLSHPMAAIASAE